MQFNVSGSLAVMTCLVMASGYVSVLYMLPNTIRRLPRDHPTHILARFLLICIFCAICPFILALYYDDEDVRLTFAEWLGIRWNGLVPATILPLVVTSVLFLGSLVANSLQLFHTSKQFRSNGVWLALKNTTLYYSLTHDSMPSLRNYILGPLTEEFVFRSCMIPLLVCADFGVNEITFGCPLAFGIAHLHHFFEHVKSGRPIGEALLIVGFQFFYTSVFGAYATFLFLRTGHFITIFTVHILCNVLGFPDLSFYHPDNVLYSFRGVILASYVIGIFGFYLLLMPLTDPDTHASNLWNVTLSSDSFISY